MPYTISAKCPCCKKVANSKNQIDEKFGWRNMDNGETIPQSYCRDCRKAYCGKDSPCKVKR